VPAAPKKTSRYSRVNLLDVEDVALASGFGHRWEAHAARAPLGAEQTGLIHFRLRPGKRSPFSHKHEKAEEIYVILEGTGKIKLDDELLEVHPRDAIRVAPGVARALEAGPDGLEFLAVGAHHPADGEKLDDPWVS
jgi:uncharacterized cupin superfamily protein